jgi:hypothetical protein
MLQPDDIEDVIFKKRPNIYYIQPDGYVNFSEIDKGYYKLDNNEFRTYLDQSGFKVYSNFRSNYNSTLASNTATFSMRHHYNNSGFNFTETINGRDIIITKNAVLNIFKNNNYKTHFLAEWPYLLANQPKMGYDVSNFKYKELSMLGTGFSEEQDVLEPLKGFLKEEVDQSKFFFIEIFQPGHIPAHEVDSEGAIQEREHWMERLATANKKLKKIISAINSVDPDGLILILGDHGGYVGMDYMMQMREKTMDIDRLYSIFSTNLAIKWTQGMALEVDKNFKIAVNVFRILFSYMGDQPSYLEFLEKDVSYLIINKGAPKGVYQCIDEKGDISFKKHDGT